MRTTGRALLGAAIALLIAAVPPAAGAAAGNRLVAEIPIELERNKTILEVEVGDSGPLRLILDSGMANDGILLFDAERVDLSRFDDVEPADLHGAGAGSPARALSVDSASFSIGGLRFDDQRMTLLTGGTFRGFPTDGVIGHSLLGHYAVEIDYDRSRMLLWEAASFVAGEGWQALDIRFVGDRIPWTDLLVSTAGEEPVRLAVYIDFASGEALELLERETNAFTSPAAGERVYLGRGLSGDIHGRQGRIASLRLGAFTLRDVAVVVTPAAVRSKQPGADAVLGSDALRRFNLVFDYAHEKIHLRPNRSFAEPFRFPPRRPAPPDP